MHNKNYYLLFVVFFISLSYSQNFKIKNIKEIVLPGKIPIERPQLSKDGNWLSLESIPGGGRFDVHFVNLDDPSDVIPIKKKHNSKRNLYALQVKWSIESNEIFYFFGRGTLGKRHFYEMDINLFYNNKSYLKDLCNKIFDEHNTPIQSYTISEDYKADRFLFAKTAKDSSTEISNYTQYLEVLKIYAKGVTINHFTTNNNGQISFVKLDEKTKMNKVVVFYDEYDASSEILWDRSQLKSSAEFSPQFSKHNPEKYLAFLNNETPKSENFYLWLLTGPFNGKVQTPIRIDGPVKTNREDIYLNDLNFAWHPDGDIIFYIKRSDDGSDPIYYYNVKTKTKNKLITNTQRNKYINIVANKIVFTATGLSSDAERYGRKAYVADLVINP
jgi:hypothetical protein